MDEGHGGLLSLVLLPAAQKPAVNGVYAPFIGTWDCSKPGPVRGWTGTFSVAPTSRDTIEFTARTTNHGSIGQLSHFYVGYDRASGQWQWITPWQPFNDTGTFHNGVIAFAAPAPLRERFRLAIGQHEMSTRSFYDDAFVVKNYANDVIRCSRDR